MFKCNSEKQHDLDPCIQFTNVIVIEEQTL